MIAAIVPAAGRSERMGRAKLLLPIDGEPMIGRVVSALRQGGADRVLVVGPPSDSDEGPSVARLALASGAEVVSPSVRPAEMRHSIEVGLKTLTQTTPPSHVVLAPGDAAGITPAIVAQVLEVSTRHPEKIVVPRSQARRGHPLVLPWNVASQIQSLPKGQGVNALVARHQDTLIEVVVDDPRVAEDIDTPDDFQRWNLQPQRDPPPPEAGGPAPTVPSKPAGRLQVQVRFFALAKERAGVAEMDLDLPPTCTVSDVRAEIARLLPGLAPFLSHVMIAVNEEYADDDTRITPGARVAVIPPVSGGAEGAGRSDPNRGDFTGND
jgi:molybdenum cofactor cytidylyltransferase